VIRCTVALHLYLELLVMLLVLDEYVIGNSYWSSATGER
jgi:hypothetical protein